MAKRNYSLAADTPAEYTAPTIHYQPRSPKRWRPRIALIGCGGISQSHLRAYRSAGWEVVALCDIHREAALARRAEFYPDADAYTDYRQLLDRPDIHVVDIALHPEQRLEVIQAALESGKHVLSQKPFVLDLADGERLVEMARAKDLKLAVNHNGRWSPYAAYALAAVGKGWIGKVQSVSMTLHWDHTWIAGTPFESMRHVLLYDFAIHWFDLICGIFSDRPPTWVSATHARVPDQTLSPPMLGHALIRFEDGLATLHLDGHSRFGPEESWVVTGSRGTLVACGGVCAAHDLRLFTKKGIACPKLEGQWFDDGFRGAMGELLCAIESHRQPSNSAVSALRSLALCFAAMKAADTLNPQTPGKVRRAPAG